MHQVTARTHMGQVIRFDFIDYDYAKLVFDNLKACIDAESVVMVNGMTGEVEWEWDSEDLWVVVNGTVL